MNDRSEEKRLSTADMLRQRQEPSGEKHAETAHKDTAPSHETIERDGAPPERHDRPTPLFDSGEATRVREQWQDIQASFVDEPRRAVESADELVAELMQRLAEVFARERSQLEHQWDRDGDVSTEDLRIAFQRYRSFFDRLLSV